MVIDRSFKVNGSKWPHFQFKKPKCNGKLPIFRGNDQRFRLKSLNFRESRNHEIAKIPHFHTCQKLQENPLDMTCLKM